MSQFFDKHLLLEGENVITSSWSANEQNMCIALATDAPRIIFVNDEGVVAPNFEIKRGKTKATFLQWHPMLQALAIGWADGCVTLWNEDERLSREEKVLHKGPISIITFSQDGSRMVTGDKLGTVGVWRTHRGMTPVCQYSRDGAISNIVFCSLLINQDRNSDNVNSLFFFGGSSGSVCLADDLKNCSEVCKVPGQVKSILFHEKENSVIIITSHLLLVQFKLNLSERLVPDRKVKLAVAGNPELLNTIWAGPGLLATVSGENMIRMFNIESDENYVLTLADNMFQNLLFQDKIVSLNYNAKRRILSGGTKNGFVIMWQCRSLSADSPSSSDEWEAKPAIKTSGNPVTQLRWANNQQMLAAIFPQGITILTHTILKKKMKENFKMMQISNRAVEVRLRNDQSSNSDFQIIMTLGMNIKGLDCCGNLTLFWNGKYAQLYEVKGNSGPQLLGNFNCASTVCALTQDTVVKSEANKLEVCSFQGEVKQVLPLSEIEGEITQIDTRGKYMAMSTSKSMIKMFDISRRTYKQIGVTRKFEQKAGESLGEIKEISLNADGKKLCILADQCPFPSIRIPDTKFYIYDIDMDNFMEMELSPNRIPVEAFWDQIDPRLIVIETEYHKDVTKGIDGGLNATEHKIDIQNINQDEIDEDFKKKNGDEFNGKTVETFFVTTDYKIKRQDVIKFEEGEETILGVQVPFFYLMGRKMGDNQDDGMDQNIEQQQNENQENKDSHMIILRKPMKDFSGLETVDGDIKKAIMNFSFYLTVGNMDEAYNSVRNIKNNTVWHNMAQMCVKTKRLDVAMVCLGNMRFARGARAAREAEKEKEPEAQLAMIAIQLNMIEDAKRLYKECGRYDLLCKLHQACGEWEEAIDVAEKFNRINLKNTHYSMAKHFESTGQVDDAIRHYIASNTHTSEVPRMLCQFRQFERLLNFVQQQREPELYKWWAQYLESQNMIQEALSFYKDANDYGSVVRVLCHVDQVPAALKLALESNDPMACFQLARYYEQMNNIREAIVYYSKSNRLHHAIRLAMDQALDQEVMTMSLMSSKSVMIQSAQYFEKKGKFDKAVSLYSRGGNKKRAMDLAIKYNLSHMIDDISTGVSENDDPEVMKQSVSFLIQNKMFDKAVDIMISLGNTEEALSIAESEGVNLSEENAMKLIPPTTTDPNKKKQRTETMLRVAKVLKKRGNFKAGAKIYTMANEKMKGMKCLLKSGEVKAVIGFAQNARQAEVYVLAGNFLQNQNWHNDPDIMKTIISFYSKAKSFESLANFYDACAQVEIDEYRDYEKALGAMKEAMRQLEKSGAANKQVKITMMQNRINTIEKFVQARQALNSGDTSTMASICDNLVEQTGAEDAIRIGDVFAQLIDHYFEKGNIQQAYVYLEKMKKRKIVVTPYLDPQIVQDIYKGMGMKMPTAASNDNNDGIDEDINEEIN